MIHRSTWLAGGALCLLCAAAPAWAQTTSATAPAPKVPYTTETLPDIAKLKPAPSTPITLDDLKAIQARAEVVARYALPAIVNIELPDGQGSGVIVSPDEMNSHVHHVLIAPVSSGSAAYPTRIPLELLGSTRYIVLDQLQTVDSSRLVKKIGEVDKTAQKLTLTTLQELFAD